MKRNHLVFLIAITALILIGWSGVINHRRRGAEGAGAGRVVLVPEAGSTAPAGSDGLIESFAAPSPLQNKPAPSFTLVDLDGRKVSLGDYRGKAVLVNFWATWCGPCKVEIPWFKDLRNQYSAQGFEILGVSNDDIDESDKAKMVEQESEIRTFALNMHMNYPVLLRGDTITEPYGGVDSLPTSFFIDRKGIVVAQTNGLHSRAEVEADIKKALASGGE